MGIYTKTGDGGTTSLLNNARVAKCDDRIELLGTIDELSAQLGFAKVLLCDKGKENISKIQEDLITIMAGVADTFSHKHRIPDDMVAWLEEKIDKTESQFEREHKFVLYGGCEASARVDVARAVARRAERRFAKVNQIYTADKNAIKYINRLSDYLYVLARYIDHQS